MPEEITDIVIREVPAKKNRKRGGTPLDKNLVAVTTHLPRRLSKKLDAYVANLTARSGTRITRREVIMIAIALLIKGEHCLEEYYKLKRKPVPRRLAPKIKERKSALNEILDKALKDAYIRGVSEEDSLHLQDI